MADDIIQVRIGKSLIGFRGLPEIFQELSVRPGGPGRANAAAGAVGQAAPGPRRFDPGGRRGGKRIKPLRPGPQGLNPHRKVR
jgi:hypothetical protein